MEEEVKVEVGVGWRCTNSTWRDATSHFTLRRSGRFPWGREARPVGRDLEKTRRRAIDRSARGGGLFRRHDPRRRARVFVHLA